MLNKEIGKVDYNRCDFCMRSANLANQRLGKLMWFKPEYFLNRYWVHFECGNKSRLATLPYEPEVCKTCNQILPNNRSISS